MLDEALQVDGDFLALGREVAGAQALAVLGL
jgi:hypothetical protein